MLAIEIDGESHYGNEKLDEKRQRKIENYGIEFLRFDDLDVVHKLDLVIDKIEKWRLPYFRKASFFCYINFRISHLQIQSMNPKSKRLFARSKTEYGNYAPRKITFRNINQNPYEFMLGRLLILRRYSDYKLLKQIFEYQKQKIKTENTANKLAHFRLEQWMPTASFNSFGGRLLGKIRNKSARTALALFTVFLFCLPVYAEDVTGRVIENGSSYGVPAVKVEIYANGIPAPTTTFTDSQGNFSSSVVGVEESPNAELLNFDIAVGPNPGATQTLRFYNPKPGRLEITVYELATGEKIKELFNGELNTGTYLTDWDGMNEHGQRASDGRYAYIIKTETASKVIKTILNKHAPYSNGTEYLLKKEQNSLHKSTELDTWQLDNIRFSGTNIETQTLKNFPPQNGDLNIGTTEVEGTNIVTGYAYDLDTKYSNRTGIANLEVKIKSIPEKTILSNENGIFIYKTTRTGTDSIIITSPEYYNWKHPINIIPLTEVKAFNDATGIPLIQRYADPENGEDLIEFTQKITDVRNKRYGTHSEFDYTTSRFAHDTVLVYLNRENTPVSYYPDLSLAGMKTQENEKRTFIETMDSAAATIHMMYNNVNVGNGENMIIAFDENGQPYLKNWDINIAGPNALIGILKPEWVAPVVAHELEHAIFTSGEHSQHAKDLISIDPIWYYATGYPTSGSEKEILARKIISHLERNPKLLEYYK